MKYTVINHEARKLFELNTLEYCLADSIYHLSNGPNSNGWAEASRQYYSKFLGVSKRHVGRMIKKLEEKQLIINSSGSRMKTTGKWYREVIIDQMKNVDKMSTMDNMSMQSAVSSISEGEEEDNKSIKDNMSASVKSGQNVPQKRTKSPSEEDNMSTPSNKDVYKGFYKYERESYARASDSLKTRIAGYAIQAIEEHQPAPIQGLQKKEAGLLIGKISDWISHLQEHKKLSLAQTKSNVETILLRDNPKKYLKYNLNGGYKNLCEPPKTKKPVTDKTYSFKQANDLFARNSLGGTNGTGIDFWEVFEKVSGEGADTKLKLREGKDHLIKNWN